MNGMEVLEIKNEESKPANVEEAIAAGWKTVKEMYEVAGVDRRTWENFVADVRNAMSKKLDSSCETGFTTEKCITGAHNTKYYHPKVEEAFQAWLMKNQANQGKSSQVVKQATMDNLQVGLSLQEIIKSGNVEAIDEYISIVRNATIAEHNYKLEQAKNQQLVHALEYDEVKDWKPWNKLKNDWKQYFELLRHKINYTKLFDEVGLVENEDYKKKVMGFDKFPTVLVSPEAEDMLWDWLDGHN